jgi:hypothetical protein
VPEELTQQSILVLIRATGNDATGPFVTGQVTLQPATNLINGFSAAETPIVYMVLGRALAALERASAPRPCGNSCEHFVTARYIDSSSEVRHRRCPLGAASASDSSGRRDHEQQYQKSDDPDEIIDHDQCGR